MGGERRRGHTAHLRARRLWRKWIRRFQESRPGTLWSGMWDRLTATDFFNHALQLSALSLLCFFPMLIVLTEATGRDTAETVVRWLGVNEQAAQAVASLFVPGPGSDTVTVVSGFLMALGAVAVAGTLQSWYQLLFDVTHRGWRDLAAQVAWLVWLLVFSAVQSAMGRLLEGLPLRTLAGFVWSVAFWWGTIWVLLAGVLRWRPLFSPALVTSVCWAGLGLFSARYFSASIVANEQRYGPVGVVMIIMSWLVAVGVVIHLGAVVGRMFGHPGGPGGPGGPGSPGSPGSKAPRPAG
ncbi:ribonuclease BN [Streptomyces sp. WAC05374]|uniref:ribonuclease BN n=1 Tax=Streptomyces sp. WAC05374 TaxID=2487420 RepID=UPI000F88CFEB|nr:ribonuclease BN [Streptomyces sp. WAC05374]RST19041.1 ribonuclease BN [Streptomyces sp. WAC05374]TDF36991.1 ribonuclease BN [Streptomyces sp. WAC05374]TDF46486.1 ribonuclease BN [Streptomyces sp. WAC05374]TDF47587.1 ribonuclease BN [Streptomyces sp. WAC05374]